MHGTLSYPRRCFDSDVWRGLLERAGWGFADPYESISLLIEVKNEMSFVRRLCAKKSDRIRGAAKSADHGNAHGGKKTEFRNSVIIESITANEPGHDQLGL